MHISELAQHHVENPREIIQPGDPVRVKILEIDSERRRLSLSIKRVEGQVLPVRPITPPIDGDAGDLDDVPELGLSEDVFAGDGPPRGRRCRACRAPRPRRPRRAEASRPSADEPRGRARGGRPSRGVEPRRRRPPRRRADAGAPPTTPRAAARTGRLSARVPFIGLTGGIGAGKSTALDALERRARRCCRPIAVVHELYGSDEVVDGGRERFGPAVAPGGVVDRAAVARRGVRHARGPGVARGPAVAARRRADGRLAESAVSERRRAAARGRRRGAAAVRVGDGGALRRDDRRRSPARTCAPRGPARGGTRRSPSAPRASFAGGKSASCDVRGR